MIRTVLGIEGMMCGMCEAHINDAVRRAFPVKSVKANRKRKECVILSEDAPDAGRLRQVIADTGYTLTGIEAGPYVKKSLFG